MIPTLTEWQHLKAQLPEIAEALPEGELRLVEDYASRHGKFSDEWLPVIEKLQKIVPAGECDYQSAAVTSYAMLDANARRVAEDCLLALMPWRKGPFSLGGIALESEWHSDWKYQRLLEAGLKVAQKSVLDVGTGNGYFLYRFLGSGARAAVGIDPSWLFYAQFLALQRFMSEERAIFFPTLLDTLPLTGFDVTLSMGVLYHRRDPLGFLAQLKDTLKIGGTLVIETLVVDGDKTTIYMPEKRYAGMRNVWFLPSREVLVLWLKRLGFAVDYVSEAVATTPEEQHRTHWMRNYSFAEMQQLREAGEPPAQRALLLARKRN